MGHNDIDFAHQPGKPSSTFASDAQNKLILNTVMWLEKATPPPRGRRRATDRSRHSPSAVRPLWQAIAKSIELAGDVLG